MDRRPLTDRVVVTVVKTFGPKFGISLLMLRRLMLDGSAIWSSLRSLRIQAATFAAKKRAISSDSKVEDAVNVNLVSRKIWIAARGCALLFFLPNLLVGSSFQKDS